MLLKRMLVKGSLKRKRNRIERNFCAQRGLKERVGRVEKADKVEIDQIEEKVGQIDGIEELRKLKGDGVIGYFSYQESSFSPINEAFLLGSTFDRVSEEFGEGLKVLASNCKPSCLFVGLEKEALESMEKEVNGRNSLEKLYFNYKNFLLYSLPQQYLLLANLSKEMGIPLFGLKNLSTKVTSTFLKEREVLESYHKLLSHPPIPLPHSRSFVGDVEDLFRTQPEAIFYRKEGEVLESYLLLSQKYFPLLFQQIVENKASHIFHTLLSLLSSPPSPPNTKIVLLGCFPLLFFQQIKLLASSSKTPFPKISFTYIQ